MTSTTLDTAARRADFEAWRERRTATLREPHGWLSLTGLHWLDSSPQAVDGLPGRWWSAADGVHLRAAAADGLRLDGEVVDGEVVTAPAEGGAGPVVEDGDRHVEVIRRSGTHALRVRDPHAPLLATFTGVPVFDFDERWVVAARYEPFGEDLEVVVGSVVEGLRQRFTAAGTARFEVGGAPQSLVLFRSGSEFSVLFTDATSGVSTTGTTRSLAVEAPTADGRVVLDFNRAANMPCAFTDHATCPLPPAENRLRVPVEAGEKAPR
ncbi:DUF1684 domain-containing protein [Kineococcus sp. R8]|uniref:DUF1684 domain-containing protein n=1 Tax=Kineococcus siccus TaxID=2696567 RepID=UPI00141327BC|nr:DUF1684 domain-containing protein [Kineococcus siccus]NAZ83275.1 DUF1684 domain-containing protein [Kineococcus siccus]